MTPAPAQALSMPKRLWTALQASLSGLASEPTIIICVGSALLVVSHYQGSTGYFRTIHGGKLDAHPAIVALGHFWWFGSSLIFYMFIPLLVSGVTRGSFHRNYGLGLGDWRAGLKISLLFLAVMLPATWYASTWDEFKGAYPLAGPGAYTLNQPGGKGVISWKLFMLYEAAYFAYFVGWEFFFRGWMVNGLLPTFGRVGAILIPVAPFAIMHIGKAETEAVGSIIAGVALGVLSLRTRSFWYGVVLHGSIAVWMDWLSARQALA
jgi:membrane protease YdiL (CAAX protease family)